MKYDALNRLTNMLDGVGTTAYSYASFGALQSEDGPCGNDAVSYSYTNRMRAGLSLAQITGGAWTNSIGYDANRRLKNIASPAGTFNYGYRNYQNWAERYPDGNTPPLVLAGSLVESIGLPNSTTLSTTHDILGRVTAKTGHTYSYDDAHRRTRHTRAGGDYVDYTYDDIGELKTAIGKELAGANRVHERFGYTYDAAGNLNYRTNNALVQTFNVDSLNQLTSASRSGNTVVAGMTSIDATSVTVATNGSAPVSAIRYADRTFALTNVPLLNGHNTFAATAQDSLGRTDTSSVTVSLPSTVGYIYDLNGNLRTNGTTVFTYDDENQLTQVVVTNATKSEFSYDGKMRRRVRKESVWANGDWRQVLEVRYIYDGNLVLQERHYDSQLGATLPQRTVSYTRGLDLSGSLQGAGGIGGLLARTESILGGASTTAYYHSDANGNVTALYDVNQNAVARYLYDPFGGVLAMSGPLAEANLYRFSSKDAHQQSGLVYYLYRYYEPQLQRWITRDPLGDLCSLVYHLDQIEPRVEPMSRSEKAVMLQLAAYPLEFFTRVNTKLTCFVGNDPLSNYDPFGLDFSSCWSECMDMTSNIASKCLSGAAAANGIANGVAGGTGRSGFQGVKPHATTWQHKAAGGRGGTVGKVAKAAGRIGLWFTLIMGGWDLSRAGGCAASCSLPEESEIVSVYTF